VSGKGDDGDQYAGRQRPSERGYGESRAPCFPPKITPEPISKQIENVELKLRKLLDESFSIFHSQFSI
jgi:hypothetical protein